MKHLESLSEFAVCGAVLTEARFPLPYPSQRQRLRALLGVQALPVANECAFWLEVFDWLIKYAAQQPDWADACLVVLSGRDTDAN